MWLLKTLAGRLLFHSEQLIDTPHDAGFSNQDPPLTEIRQTTEIITQRLRELNDGPVPPEHRIRHLDSFHASVQSVTASVQAYYTNATFPLSSKVWNIVEMTHELYLEMARGYKKAVIQIIRSTPPDDRLDNLTRAVFYAIWYFNRVLLLNYLTYRPATTGVWQEIHRLYLLAEHKEILDADIRAYGIGVKKKTDINTLYKQTLLLSLAHPAGESQQNIALLLEALDTWAPLISINKTTDIGSRGQFVCITDHDVAPRHLKMIRGRTSQFWRLVDTNNAIRMAQQELIHRNEDALSTRRAGYEPRPQLPNGTLLRLTRRWSAPQKRCASRNPTHGRAMLTIGMDRTHGLVATMDNRSGLHMQEPVYPAGIPAEGITSASAQTVSPPPAQIPQPPPEVSVDNGLIYSSGKKPRPTEPPPDLNNPFTPSPTPAPATSRKHASLPCTVVNFSSGGACITVHATDSLNLRVGELVTLVVPGKDGQQKTLFATIRWLKNLNPQTTTCGLKIAVSSAMAIRTSSKQNGVETEKMKSLLFPENGRNGRPKSVLVPSGVFRVGETIRIHLRDKTRYVKLTRILDSTDLYTRFSFDVIKPAAKPPPPRYAKAPLLSASR